MENPFDRIVRPLNEKHIVRAILAFVLTEAGELLSHEDGDPEELKALKARVKVKAAKAAKAAQAGEEEGEEEGGQVAAEGGESAGKAE